MAKLQRDEDYIKRRLHRALVSAVDEAAAPGAVALVTERGETRFEQAVGLRQRVPAGKPAKPDTIYDLASLTKVVATTTAVLLARDDGLIDLDAPVSELIPIPEFEAFTCRHLLTHTAGLPAGRPYWREVDTLDEMLMRYAEHGLDWQPGTARRYSDIGFMILGRALELAGGESLSDYCRKRIFVPLRMERTAFNPPEDWADQCAATENCRWRERILVGEVHDENASAVGGCAGHAGLFSTAGDLARFATALTGGKLLAPSTLREMTRLGQVPHWPWQGLGWLLDPWGDSSGGFLPSRLAFGHSGWTGTSLWVDGETGLAAILLSNTCHPGRGMRNNRALREGFHSAVAATFYGRQRNTHTGLDRLVRERFRLFQGKRIALLTNHSAVDSLGRHILDVFALAPGVKLQALYSPEHGIRGQAEAGERVTTQQGPVPVISLYGERKEPSQEELAEVHYFVVDLQDAGARYYTYAATMKRCMKACAKAGKPLVVLDRPNPVGGAVLEGPLAETGDELVCWGRVPVRHGMTLGEIATWFAEQELGGEAPRLNVVPMDCWVREALFQDCLLPWVPPSPNIPSPETALVYAGMCLFEGTNLNEGRGTPEPFHLVGAPWLNAGAVISGINEDERPGLSLEAVRYTPRAIQGKAANPRYEDIECNGIRVHVEDGQTARPFTLAVSLLSRIRARHAGSFEWRDSFDVLAGTPALREAIEAGEDPLRIIAGFAEGHARFEEERPQHYA